MSRFSCLFHLLHDILKTDRVWVLMLRMERLVRYVNILTEIKVVDLFKVPLVQVSLHEQSQHHFIGHHLQLVQHPSELQPSHMSTAGRIEVLEVLLQHHSPVP